MCAASRAAPHSERSGVEDPRGIALSSCHGRSLVFAGITLAKSRLCSWPAFSKLLEMATVDIENPPQEYPDIVGARRDVLLVRRPKS